jgi:hypothetical protein
MTDIHTSPKRLDTYGGKRYPDLDMARPTQQALVKCTSPLPLCLLVLKVDIRLPKKFRHIHRFLVDSELKDAPSAIEIFEKSFELGKLDPRRGICMVILRGRISVPATSPVKYGNPQLTSMYF